MALRHSVKNGSCNVTCGHTHSKALVAQALSQNGCEPHVLRKVPTDGAHNAKWISVRTASLHFSRTYRPADTAEVRCRPGVGASHASREQMGLDCLFYGLLSNNFRNACCNNEKCLRMFHEPVNFNF